MRIQLLAGVAVIAVGVGLSPLTSVAAPVHAAPSNPLTPCSECLPGPGGGPGGQSITGHGFLPAMGGGPKTGRPSVALPGAHTAPPILP
jgi:hypothetical protein